MVITPILRTPYTTPHHGSPAVPITLSSMSCPLRLWSARRRHKMFCGRPGTGTVESDGRPTWMCPRFMIVYGGLWWSRPTTSLGGFHCFLKEWSEFNTKGQRFYDSLWSTVGYSCLPNHIKESMVNPVFKLLLDWRTTRHPHEFGAPNTERLRVCHQP